ncbi:immune-associated nucleotide-binding protein 9 isoform X2 [Coffea arabica]|uniref:Immune-associated nucleotide-binding protein 9 isoform X2 n=1 Tax=Coffea arabica TaxID=13443 RepID=A0A6P6UV99_COFAR|nr:immune-associated nucleotide-binding protein 9-like isoform X1 [Coffea arabica]XP_027094659.1 immune-associated nucleotide-binding protein 9-like isoform X1 [Coffea arabica]
MGGSFIDDDWESGSASHRARTVVLVGRTGDGKSATGNSILGRKAFKSMNSPDGITSTSELQTAVLEDGQIINVIDTPGLFNKSAEPQLVGKEIVRCIDMAKDGIHAVLVVVSLSSRISIEEAATVETLQKLFGDKITKYMILVFTGGDDFEEDEVDFDDYLSRSESIKGMLEICGNRWVLFDNKTKNTAKKAEQLKQLLSLVDDVDKKNGGKPYTNELFVEFQKAAAKLRDQAKELNSLEGYSKEEKIEREVQIYQSYEEHLARSTDMVETKLREAATHELEQRLAEEQDARLKAEQTVRETRAKSDNEICELRQNLERSQRVAEQLKKFGKNLGCHIM